MTKIKLSVSRAGPTIGVQTAGDVVEVDPDEALRMVKSGQAELVDAKAEKAVAVKRTRKAAK